MAYNNVISRTDAAALIPEEVSAEIIKSVPEASVVMQLGRRLQNMSRGQKRLPVMSALATAYFVSGDTGLKQTSEVDWESKYIDAEELAVIIPIPEAVLDDTDYDIWGEVKPSIIEAFGIAADAAVLYGTNIPASWTTNLGSAGLVAGAVAASQTVDYSTQVAAGDDLYTMLLDEGGVWNLVEEDGFLVDGSVAAIVMKARLRGVRSSDGQLIFNRSMSEKTTYELDGAPVYFPANGAVDAATSLLIAGAWKQLVYSIRKDVTYKVLTEAVIQDASGNIIYNLAQQDMVALRCVFRLGFALPNPINRMQETAASRYPFAVLVP